MRKPNDVIIRGVTKVVVVIIFTFAINLFISGHHYPGGGFIGGLAFSSGIILLFLTFDMESVRKNIPVDFKVLAAIGVLIAVLTGVGGMLLDAPFLSQSFGYFELPIFGKTELATAVLFDVGVALAVIGTSLMIIMSIGDDR
ncbi:multisubunit sodium/proton antiporter, MrpB subunit [Schinkia azotoformans MEV2011]|uniref:Multisubunit sodium/proton antiporter, MrpB subunit n=1 Tax=Schinkia azotoformans MEV2011 TaxID=1348973 RepID=A0A072NIF1_SCHAZ|nr:Na(+)/H(+) antiporter subunit B [Schinkia azotoformans]KEF36638.1 multisubunit sodium/proton antiporter, MrpB subunit [Schinkia azotoformans MEV2011]MEC1695603.1 Na(+)/H(+) antiporter subunit B [Schinkia azotoformans]MEC1714228.1 Na(+)/H(+) antiporter subunit B [Schinkia azotoformans]MEC1723997.1 Na(+)/H(+) antiporter subunit B [Schinkia azotoformans]MEC1742443.1 Na(+)/H(+) antiporter subunit B [Schinkia azotoformans]